MADNTKVTRIKATDDSKSAKKPVKKAATNAPKAPKKAESDSTEPKKNVFARIGGYFKGAWEELKQVRWPNRAATWQLTLAVILFSLFFLAIIVALDSLFKYLFELIIT